MTAGEKYSNSFLNAKRLIGDAEADKFVHYFFAESDLKANLFNWLQSIDLQRIPTEYSTYNFITKAVQLPQWADAGMMQQGSSFFVTYAEQIMQLLGLLSLPYCYAAADGAMVLYLTQRIKNNPAKRLFDTAEFIWDVMSPAAFQQHGKGFTSCLKIRLTHAAARYYTLKSGSWDNSLGYPVNQEDMAGTNLSFSLIVIRGLRKLGYAVSYNDQQAFMHLWNVIGFLLGLDDDLIPQDGKSANALEKAIRERHFKASVHGRQLAQTLINYFSGMATIKVSQKQTIILMRYLLGNAVADMLELPVSETPAYLPAMLKLSANWPAFKSDLPAIIMYQKKYLEFKKMN